MSKDDNKSPIFDFNATIVRQDGDHIIVSKTGCKVLDGEDYVMSKNKSKSTRCDAAKFGLDLLKPENGAQVIIRMKLTPEADGNVAPTADPISLPAGDFTIVS